MTNLKRYIHSKWVIAVSGGPDSMALLDLCFKQGLDFESVHVNYHKRDTAVRDQKIVEDYCLERDIKLSVFHAHDLVGNFQMAAREYRYEQCRSVILSSHADGMMVAHHKDDDLETYFFQRQRNSLVSWFGLKEETLMKGVRLIRPLLSLSKQDLITYCEMYQVPYGVDESNTNLNYTRNRIREELSRMSDEQRDHLQIEKNEKNSDLQMRFEEYSAQLSKHLLSEDEYKTLSKEWPLFLMHWLIRHEANKALSRAYLEELDRQLLSVTNIVHPINDELRLIKQYKTIRLASQTLDYEVEIKYKETLNGPVSFGYEASVGSIKFVCEIKDFPITIRNYKKAAKEMDSLTKQQCQRWFIKHKIPLEEREGWPLVFNTSNELIYISHHKQQLGVSTDTIECYMIK